MMTDTAKKNFSTVFMTLIAICFSTMFYLHYNAMHQKNLDKVITPDAGKKKVMDTDISPTKLKY